MRTTKYWEQMISFTSIILPLSVVVVAAFVATWISDNSPLAGDFMSDEELEAT